MSPDAQAVLSHDTWLCRAEQLGLYSVLVTAGMDSLADCGGPALDIHKS